MANCLECGDKLIGRTDKKFCNDSCRNAYNNKNNPVSSHSVKEITKKIQSNYKILLSLNFTEGKTQILQEKLQSLGFDFEFITQIKLYKNGSEYRFVYNIGYKFLENGWLLIVKND